MANRSADQSTNPSPPHLGPVRDDDRNEHAGFDAIELAIVLSHYDLGPIERIRAFRRGSRRAPKLKIRSAKGEYLLKRRAPGRDDPQRVAFAHDLQIALADRGYPLPGLIGTRSSNSSMIQHNGRTFELFNFIDGKRDDGSPESAFEAGRTLGRLHALLEGYSAAFAPPSGSFHASPQVAGALKQVPAMVSVVEPAVSVQELQLRCDVLFSRYQEAAAHVAEAGFGGWPVRVLHGDWHPGNMLYKDGAIIAVLDFDSARLEPRIIDLANAALQFSMGATEGSDPSQWPEHLDVRRMRALIDGYAATSGEALSEGERAALPWLIQEALILESVIPIAATGRFAQLSGAAFLAMVQRKIDWLRPRAGKLREYLEMPA